MRSEEELRDELTRLKAALAKGQHVDERATWKVRLTEAIRILRWVLGEEYNAGH